MGGKLIVDLREGLGNRLGTLLSAWVIAEHAQIDLEVRWRRSVKEGANIRFCELFAKNQSGRLTVLEADLEAPLQTLLSPSITPETIARIRAGDTVELSSYSSFTYEGLQEGEFRRGFKECFGRLPLHPEVEHLMQAYAPRTIGLHLRFTDHIPAHICSPRALYRLVTHECLRLFPKHTIWACGDAPGLLRELNQAHGPRVVIAKAVAGGATPDRTSKRDLQLALAELVSLSRSAIIIASPLSSFASLASQLNGAQLIPVTVSPLFQQPKPVRLLWKFAHAYHRSGVVRVGVRLIRSRLYQDFLPRLLPAARGRMRRSLLAASQTVERRD